MFITKTHLSRRTVLRAAGATVALPWLEGMVPALTALSQSEAAPARRMGVFYVPNGMAMGYWWPETEGTLGDLPPTLRSLQAHKEQVLLLGGLSNADAANNTTPAGDHARSAGTFLTCVPFRAIHGRQRRRRHHDGPAGRAAVLAGDAARVARAGAGVGRDAGCV